MTSVDQYAKENLILKADFEFGIPWATLLIGCHLTSKQLEEFMDDDCHGPVTSGDPMLSSPHLSPHDVLPSPASSGSHYSANDDALTPDSMDLAV